MSVRSGALRRTAETPVADRAPGPLSCRQPKMEFLLGNPFSTPVGQCLGKAARRTGLGGRRRRPTRPWGPRASAGHGATSRASLSSGPAHGWLGLLTTQRRSARRRPGARLALGGPRRAPPIAAQPFPVPEKWCPRVVGGGDAPAAPSPGSLPPPARPGSSYLGLRFGASSSLPEKTARSETC